MNKRKKNQDIQTLSKKTQVIYNWCGAYDMGTGTIMIGSDESHTPTILWHESVHKVLYEYHDLESCYMWDNISDKLQLYLFNIEKQIRPYIYQSPTSRAKPIDDGWLNGRKQREKSEKIPWKPLPIRIRKKRVYK
jgi:hypothetical protein